MLNVSLDVSAVPRAPGGAGRYTLDLAAALARRADLDLTVLSRRADAERWDSVLGPSGGQVVAAAPRARPLRLAWEQTMLGRRLRRAGVDVHHGPHYTMPTRAGLPVVVTVHDCTFFDHPEWHQRSKVVLFRRAITVAARRASAIVCVSQATADRLGQVADVVPRVFVAPHGVDHQRFTPHEPEPGSDGSLVRSLGIDPDWPLVVFVGTVEPRKNIASLVRAFESLAPEYPDLRLVIAGQDGWGGDEVERALVAAERHRDRVIRTGYVPDAAVPALLRRAAVVAYPSLEEGYGLPALEALACGAPLVTTLGTAMAELAGDAAVLVPPGDSAGLAAALDSVLSDGPPSSGGPTAPARSRRDLGLAVAAARTWEASAEVHMAAYRHAAGGGPPGGC